MTEQTKDRQELRSKALTALGWALCAVFGFLLLCNLTIIIKGTLHPEQPPSVFGVTPMAVLSGSMSGSREGHIEPGDLIFIHKAVPEELEEGDVIAYMEGTMVVTHRIVAVQTADDGALQWVTQGDANESPDAKPVTPAQLVGIFSGRIPRLGDFALFLQTTWGMLLFIGLPLLAFIVYDILRRQNRIHAESQKTAEMQAELERLRALTGEDTSP